MVKLLAAAATAAGLVILYRHGRLEKRMLVLLLILDALGGILIAGELTGGEKQEVKEIAMSRLDEAGSMQLEVQTDEGEAYEVEVNAPPKRRSTRACRRLLEEAVEEMDALILGENRSFQRIEWNLNLLREIGPAGVQAEWYSDQPDILDFDGVILPGVPKDGLVVQLYADLSLQDQTETYQRMIRVYPSREETQIRAEILYQSEQLNQNSTETEAIYRLPGEAAGRKLRWFERSNARGLILSVLALIGGLLAALSRKEKEERALAEQKEKLLRDYPELLSKIQLYLSTGLSMRSVFSRIAGEYQARRRSGAGERPAYEAVRRAVHRMESGSTELDAYDSFGKECIIPCYRGLALLLSQNLKKGGAGIIPQLEQEVQEAFEMRRRRARAEGEKTTVRLLLPMGMMLIVVMALILIPAFLSL